MGREHGAGARGLQRLCELVAGAQVGARELQWRERGMSLVEVDQARLDPERAQGADPSDPQQHVLREPQPGV